MKTASLKILTFTPQVNGLDKYRDYTGAELPNRNSPVGFYRNTDEDYKGIVFRDCNGNCTYFDVTHGLVYSFDVDIWKHSVFRLVPDMTKLSIGFSKEKKVKKVKKTLDLSAR